MDRYCMNPAFYRNPETHDKISPGKEIYNMSLVGLLKSENGLLAFGDSKNTLVGGGSEIPRYYEGEPVKKVFKGNGYLVVKHGSNTIRKCLDDDSGQYSLIKMESFLDLEDLLNEPFEIFVPKLISSILNIGIRNYEEYYFLIGRKLFTGKYLFYSLKLSRDDIYYHEIPEQNFVIMGGSLTYAITNLTINKMDSLETLKEIARDIMEIARVYGDKHSSYNPVGGKLQIETLI